MVFAFTLRGLFAYQKEKGKQVYLATVETYRATQREGQ